MLRHAKLLCWGYACMPEQYAYCCFFKLMSNKYGNIGLFADGP